MVLGVAVIIFVAVTIGMRGRNGTNTQKSQCNSVYINFFLCLFCSQRCSNEKWDERSLLLRHLKFSHEEGCQFDDEKAQTRRRDSQVRLNVLFLFVLFSATDLKKKQKEKERRAGHFYFSGYTHAQSRQKLRIWGRTIKTALLCQAVSNYILIV